MEIACLVGDLVWKILDINNSTHGVALIINICIYFKFSNLWR